MRSWRWQVRRCAAVAGLLLGVSAPIAGVGAPSAGAALPPVAGCGFHLGPISEQGAAGTLYYSMVLRPDSPVQHCTVPVNFTASIAPLAPGGTYTDIDHDPLTATETVSFVPGRLPPILVVSWSGFHCADPVVPGALTISTGTQQGVVGIAPDSCGPPGSQHSSLGALTIPSISAVGIAPTLTNHGYRTVYETGFITGEGDAGSLGVAASSNAPVVGIAAAPAGDGVWVAAADGGVFAYGSAPFYGSLGSFHLNAPIVGMAPTKGGGGYWLVAADGGVFSFGDAVFHGSLGNIHLNAPIVGMAADRDGGGYWLVAADGGVFTFGTAAFSGSLGSVLLAAPIVGMAADPLGGYWLVASDGGMFTFGGAQFFGSTGGLTLNAPVSGMAATASGAGYWLLGSDGGIFTFGDAGFFGAQPITP